MLILITIPILVVGRYWGGQNEYMGAAMCFEQYQFIGIKMAYRK